MRNNKLNRINKNNLDYFNLTIGVNETRILITIIIILIIILLFRKKFSITLEKIIVFSILFLLFLILTKNIVVTLISASIIFLLVNLIMKYRYTIEKFESIKNLEKEEPFIDLNNMFANDEVKKSSENIQDLLKKINGGIELKDDDKVETGEIKIDVQKYSDDKKPNALKDSQKEAYELINTVSALKDTITTLAPVLSEGRKIMDLFQSLKI
jgi:predicted membrane protein